jgi:hypothetical protein
VFACYFVALGTRASPFVPTKETNPQRPSPGPTIKTVVDLSEPQLRRLYPTQLGRIVFAKNQEELALLLRQAGEKVDAMFHNFDDTSASEQVVLRRMSSAGQTQAYIRSNFDYLILVHRDRSQIGFEEYRTDSEGKPARLEALNIGSFIVTSGFAAQCLYLHPNHQFGSRFRYLGKERAAPHAQVIAFAQKPEVGDFMAAIGTSSGPRPVLVQGLAWIDPNTYEVVRMLTDLLEPDLRDGVLKQTTETWFSDVHFADNPQPFLLPRQVEATAVYRGITYRNTHSYSGYKLFRVATRIKT